jgi:hypothetical protein
LGDHTQARSLLTEGLAVARATGHPGAVVLSLEALAGLALAQGRPALAARLFGAAAAGREAVGTYQPAVGAQVDRDVAAARARLGEDAFATAWAEGAAQSLEQAADLARSPGAGEPPPDGRAPVTAPRPPAPAR